MTDTPTEPAPSAEPAAPTPEPVVTPTPSAEPAAPSTTPDFSLPDEHKEKSWSEKVKSQDDVYKQLDNLTELVGKKTIQPIDYETATPEAIQAHYATLAPEDIGAYEFAEGTPPDAAKATGEIFKEAGLTPHQAKIVTEKYSELSIKSAEAQSDGDAYLKMLDDSFGEGKGADVGKMLDTKISEYANKDDVALLRDGIPNTTRLALDRILYNILDKHGAKESGSQVDGGDAKVAAVSLEEKRASLRKQIREVDGKPFSGDKKSNLINELNSLYTSN